jgi:hypothetical protein
MTYHYAVLLANGCLFTRTKTQHKAARLALKIQGTYKAEHYQGGKCA